MKFVFISIILGIVTLFNTIQILRLLESIENLQKQINNGTLENKEKEKKDVRFSYTENETLKRTEENKSTPYRNILCPGDDENDDMCSNVPKAWCRYSVRQ